MYIKNRVRMLLLLSICLAAGNAQAASVAGSVVYEKVDIFKGAVYFTDSFMIDTQGTYEATLTDFKFPHAFKSSGLNVTSSTDSLGKLSGPGTLTFEAEPGDYYVSMFAKVGHFQIAAEEKQRLLNEDKKRRKEKWLHSLTKEERDAKRARWRSRTEEEKEAHREKVKERRERWVEAQLESMNLGQYGIEITMLDGAFAANLPQLGTPVPLPAAVWLFGSGMLGLAGLGYRSASR